MSFTPFIPEPKDVKRILWYWFTKVQWWVKDQDVQKSDKVSLWFNKTARLFMKTMYNRRIMWVNRNMTKKKTFVGHILFFFYVLPNLDHTFPTTDWRSLLWICGLSQTLKFRLTVNENLVCPSTSKTSVTILRWGNQRFWEVLKLPTQTNLFVKRRPQFWSGTFAIHGINGNLEITQPSKPSWLNKKIIEYNFLKRQSYK